MTTIDNYPAQAATDYAHNLKIYEPHLVAPAALFELATVIVQFSAMEKAFGLLKRRQSWAHFEPPPGFFRQLNRFYRKEVIPWLTNEVVENLLAYGLPNSMEDLLTLIERTNRWLEEIICRRLQYSRG